MVVGHHRCGEKGRGDRRIMSLHALLIDSSWLVRVVFLP